MKSIAILAAALSLSGGMAYAQDVEVNGAMKPTRLNDLGVTISERMVDIVKEDLDSSAPVFGGAGSPGLSLFSGDAGEDSNILEIKRIARDLENQRAIIMQISQLQKDLISFAIADPSAAYKARMPVSVCEYGIDSVFCNAMDSSFQVIDIGVAQLELEAFIPE